MLVDRNFIVRKSVFLVVKSLVFLLCFLFSLQIKAEGSKELSSRGGYRAYLISSSVANFSSPFSTLGTVKVYVKAGEKLYLGSSANRIGEGKIVVRAPGGATYSSIDSAATAGLIANRAEEVAGPLPNAGGYTPYILTVGPTQTGVWEIDFVSPTPNVDPRAAGAYPGPELLANANWAQENNVPYVTAFDVSVRDSLNTAFIPGRVYTNVFGTSMAGIKGFNGKFHVLTNDGYIYEVTNNSLAGYFFFFFSNNKGFKDAQGNPLYKSLNNVPLPVHDPRIEDTATDFTHKLFFNSPDVDLPNSANTPSSTTWLRTPIKLLLVSDVSFEGIEGTPNVAGAYPLGGNIKFKTSELGSYEIRIDINKNGSFLDSIDKVLTGATDTTGFNTVFWDGLDGLGGKVVGNFVLPPNSINISLKGGEVHFPFLDVEDNFGGLEIKRVNGANAPDYTVHWDDSDLTYGDNVTIVPPNLRKTPVQGVDSQTNGHKYGYENQQGRYGDEKNIDTWAFLVSSPQFPYLDVVFREGDLEVLPITTNSATYCVGEEMTYIVTVRNNGPDAVSGAKFSFLYPQEFNIASVTTNFSSVNAGNKLGTAKIEKPYYHADVDLINGATITFTIKGNLSAAPAGGVVTRASIMRPADFTDPDATNPYVPGSTNPGSTPPTDPQVECDGGTVGCNNIKTHNNITLSGISINLGPNQTVVEGTGGTKTITFPVNLSAASRCDITVDYTITHNTTNNADFLSSLSGKLTIPAGQTTGNINVQILTDNIIEKNEEFTLRLSNPTGANTINRAAATGTIQNDDVGIINITKVDGYEEGAVPAKYIFSFANGVTSDCDFEIDFKLGGTATWGGVDYNGTELNTAIIPAGNSTYELLFPVIDDAIVENTETIFISSIESTRNKVPGTGAIQLGYDIKINSLIPGISVFDNDKATIRIIPSVTLNEGNSGLTTFPFSILLDRQVANPFTLNFRTSSGTALANEDFEPKNEAISFTGLPGITQVEVKVIGDNILEFDEDFNVLISDLSSTYNGNLTISEPASVGNIINDDSGILDITSANTTEGTAAAQFVFTLRDSKVADADINISYTLTGKAIGNGVDYDKAQTGTITLLKGQNSVVLYLNTFDDNLIEGTENVILTVNNVSSSLVSVPVNTSSLYILDINTTNISVADVQVIEGNVGVTTLRFKAVLNGRTDTDFTLPFTIQDVTTTQGVDYTVTTSSPISFSPNLGSQEVNIDIAVIGDYNIEPNETLQLILGTPSKSFNGNLIVQSLPATGTILDDDSGQIMVTSTNGIESGEVPVTFTFAFPTGVTSSTDTEIYFSLSGGTASSNLDYEAPLVNRVVIPVGTNSVTLTIPVTDDEIIEGTETIVLTPSPILNNPGVVVSTAAVSAEIEDDDTGTISLTGPATVVEGDAGTTTINYTIRLDKAVQHPTQISYRTADITAIAGEDYDGVLNSYTFTAGPDIQDIQVSVTIRGDKKIEANEAFRLMLNPLLNDYSGRLTLANNYIETTITNDDASNIVINTINGTEGIQDARFIIGFENGYSSDVAVNIAYTLSGSALNPTDYTGLSAGILTIPAGQSTINVDLPVIDDNLVENTENITIQLSGTPPYGILLNETQKTLDIIDNDAASISISNASVVEGNENDTHLVFDVAITGANIQDSFSLLFAVAGGTATVNEDYEIPALNSLIFNGPAERLKQIQIPVKGDLKIEKDETLNIAIGLLSNNFGGRLTINKASAVGTILNDDKGRIQIVPLDGEEEGAVSGFFQFDFLDGITSDEPTTINFNLSGSAQSPADYTTLNPLSVTIPAGQKGVSVEIEVKDDQIIEGTEAIILTTNATIGTAYPTNIAIINSPQTVNIYDNDNGELILTTEPDVLEGAAGEAKIVKFKVKLTKATASPFSVSYQFVDITAIDGEDYLASNGTWNFSGTANEEHEVSVTIIGDNKVEDPERFRFQFSNPTDLYNGAITVPVNSAIFTILNDDSAQLSITKQDGEEGGNNGYFRISLPSGVTVDKPITIDYTLSGTANAADYAASPTSIVLNANTNSVNIPINVVDDLIVEGEETVEITAAIATPLYGISFTNNKSTLEIFDNDYGTITINNVEVNELNSGINTLTFDVKLSAATQSSFDVNYYTSDITATVGEDYEAVTLANGKIIFNGNKDEIRTIEIKYFGDKKVEIDEELRVILASLSKTFDGHLAIDAPTTTGIAKLKNDDSAVVNVQITNGSEDGTQGKFRFYLEDGATADKPIAITYTLGGTAINTTAKKDYDISHPINAVILGGENYVDVTVDVIDDEIVEGTETVELSNLLLFSDYSANVSLSPSITAPNKAVLTIADNDEATITLTAADKIIEGDNGTSFYEFTLELDKETARSFEVEYFTNDISATTADQDYVSANGAQSFNGTVGETKVIQVQIIGDHKIEPDEYFSINLKEAVTNFENRLKVPVKTKQVTIENDDTAEIVITSQNGAEEGTQSGTFTFTLSNGKTVDEDIYIKYDFDNTSTASLTSDFTFSAPSPLLLAKGSNSVTLTVNTVDDAIAEGTELVKITAQTLNNPRNNISISNGAAQLEIADNDEAKISISNASVVEGNNGETNLVFNLSIDKQTQRPFTLRYNTQDGTAIAPEDYVSVSNGLLSFPALSTANQTITIKIKGDQKLEADELFKVLLSDLSDDFGGKLSIANTEATGTITNDDAAVITITGTNAKEEGEVAGTFKFSLPNNVTSDQDITINYTLAGDALGAGVDYTNALSGTVTIPANASEVTLNINVKDDNIVEFNESVIINASLDAATVYASSITLSNATHAINIEDNDTATLTLSGETKITEGNDGFTSVVYTVTLSNPVTAGFKVAYDIDELSATLADEDFQFTAGELVFSGANATSGTFTVFVKGDKKIEENENFRIRLTPDATFGGKLTVVGAPLLVEITNDDSGIISITKEDGEEIAANNKPAKFIFSLPDGITADQDIVLPYTLSANSARGEGVDYTGNLTGSITIAKNTNSAELVFPVIDDNIVEGTETVTINITTAPIPLGITLNETSKTLTIVDNDEAKISISNASVIEGNSGTSLLEFTVSLDKEVQQPFTFNYYTEDGTAKSGEDYQAITAANGSITFNALSTTAQTIRVTVNSDLKIEADETLSVVLASLSNDFEGRLTLPALPATGTILDDDTAVITITGTNGKEEGEVAGTFKFSLPNNVTSDQDITINYTLSGDALGNGVDYTNVLSGTVIIPANTSEATLNINVKDDNIVEFDESVIINASLNPATVYASKISLPTATHTIYIEDNDSSVLSIDGPLSIVEGNSGTKTLTFNVTLSNPVSSSFTVKYNSVDGTATVVDNDYQVLSGTLSFTGQTVNETYPITLIINGDSKVEGDEYLTIELEPLAQNYNGKLTISGSPARSTIIDDDNLSVNKLITISKLDGEEGTNNASFTFSFPPGISLDADTEIFFSLDGSATKDLDYEVLGSASSIIIPAGQNSSTLTFRVIDDTVLEGTETIRIITGNISNSKYQDIVISNPTTQLAILDNDNGTITVNAVSVTEGNSGTKEMVFDVTLSHQTSREFQLKYNTQNNTATDLDYVAIADGVLVLGPEAGVKQIKVLINGDVVIEKDEILNLVLQPLTDDFSGRLTIVNNVIAGEIVNDDSGIITITKTDGEEGVSPVRFKFSFPDGVSTDEPTEISYSLAGTATANVDYQNNSTGTITILPNQTSAELVLPIIDDAIVEGDETVILNAVINSVYGNSITLNPTIPVAIIKDNDFAKVKINGPISVTEGNIGTTPVNFTVTLEGNLSQSFDIKYSSQDGTATVADNDYIPKTDNVLTFTGVNGETKTITILVNGDRNIESNENFFVNLHDLSKTFSGLLSIENSPARANILDDDNNPANKLITVTKTNGSEIDLTPVTFTFSFPQGVTTDAETIIPYSLTGTATGDGVDYDGTISGNVTIPAGQNSITLTLPVKADNIVESVEIVRLNTGEVINGSYTGIKVSNPSTDAEIADANTTTLSVADIEIIEGDAGTSTAIFTIKLNGATAKPFTVDYTTEDGSAKVSDLDYVAITGKLSFNGFLNEEQKVSVVINGDKRLEADETFKLILGNIVSHYDNRLILERTEATATIKNDDSLLITVTGVDGAEENTVPAKFIFSLPSGYTSDTPVLINYTLGGQATAGGTDYVGSINGVIAIPPGEESVTLSLPVIDDNIVEKDEDISIKINSINSNYGSLVTYNPALPIVKIIDNDVATLVLSNAVQLPEGNSGTTAFTYTVTLQKATGTGFSVKYITEDGTATLADNDYNKAEGRLSFSGNHNESYSVTVLVNSDKKIEGNEVFKFKLFDLDSTFNNRLTIPVAEVNGIIENDDNSQITITKVDGIEGTQNGKFDLTLDPGVVSDRDITVVYRLSGTATNSDYIVSPASGMVTIPAGNNSASINLGIVDDDFLEETETVVFELINILNPYNNVTLKQPVPVLNIYDNDVSRLVVTSPAATIEGHLSTKAVNFSLKLENTLDKGFTVQYTTEDGTATEADNDYQKRTGFVSFDGYAGETKTITVLINGDTKIEADENFGLRLFNLSPTFDNKLLIINDEKAIILNDDIAPIATNDMVIVVEDTPKTFSITSNDTHAEGIDPATITVTVQPQYGQLIVNQDGTVTYSPALNYFGSDEFYYTVHDIFGRLSNQAKVTITVTSVNDAPVAVDDVYYVQRDSSIRENVALNDFDVDGDVLVFRRITNPQFGVIAFFDEKDGTFIYVPTAGSRGIDKFTYYVQDPSGLRDTAEVILNIQPKIVVNLIPNNGIIIEGDSISITAKLSDYLLQDVNVVLSFGGTAELNKDYTLSGNYDVLTIPARETTTTHKFSINSLKDYLKEDPETVEVNIVSVDPAAFVTIGDGATIIIEDFYPKNPSDDANANTDIIPDPYMSPNGDGLGNEKFVIYNIERYPDNEVTLFNRWGNEVFAVKNYDNKDNAFFGFANKGILTNGSHPLVNGVYYFIIKTKGSDGSAKLNKGYVIIRR